MSLQQSISDQTDMFLTLARHVSCTEAKDKNMVFSPLSLHVVLSLISAGSTDLTRDELLSFLRSESCDELHRLFSETVSHILADGSNKGGPKLKMANGVWVDQRLPLKKSFKEVVDGIFKATIDQVDFLHKAGEVVSEVNSWAAKQTNGLIQEVLPLGSVTDATKLMLANALYFKGSWANKFNASKTDQGEFHLLDGSSVEVPYMNITRKQALHTFEDFQVLRLPYKQGQDNDRQFSMYIFLPNELHGLPALMEKLSSQPGFLDEHLPFFEVKCQLKLPKFKISFGFEASNVLKGLGVNKPFSAGGLTEMVNSSMGNELYVSSIFQKSFIEVNEEGTEAAAVTVSGISACSYTHPTDFVADHPFIFLIREDTSGVVLFIGHIINPLLSV